MPSRRKLDLHSFFLSNIRRNRRHYTKSIDALIEKYERLSQLGIGTGEVDLETFSVYNDDGYLEQIKTRTFAFTSSYCMPKKTRICIRKIQKLISDKWKRRSKKEDHQGNKKHKSISESDTLSRNHKTRLHKNSSNNSNFVGDMKFTAPSAVSENSCVQSRKRTRSDMTETNDSERNPKHICLDLSKDSDINDSEINFSPYKACKEKKLLNDLDSIDNRFALSSPEVHSPFTSGPFKKCGGKQTENYSLSKVRALFPCLTVNIKNIPSDQNNLNNCTPLNNASTSKNTLENSRFKSVNAANPKTSLRKNLPNPEANNIFFRSSPEIVERQSQDKLDNYCKRVGKSEYVTAVNSDGCIYFKAKNHPCLPNPTANNIYCRSPPEIVERQSQDKSDNYCKHMGRSESVTAVNSVSSINFKAKNNRCLPNFDEKTCSILNSNVEEAGNKKHKSILKSDTLSRNHNTRLHKNSSNNSNLVNDMKFTAPSAVSENSCVQSRKCVKYNKTETKDSERNPKHISEDSDINDSNINCSPYKACKEKELLNDLDSIDSLFVFSSPKVHSPFLVMNNRCRNELKSQKLDDLTSTPKNRERLDSSVHNISKRNELKSGKLVDLTFTAKSRERLDFGVHNVTKKNSYNSDGFPPLSEKKILSLSTKKELSHSVIDHMYKNLARTIEIDDITPTKRVDKKLPKSSSINDSSSPSSKVVFKKLYVKLKPLPLKMLKRYQNDV